MQADKRIKKGWMPLAIKNIYQDTPDTKTFVFEDAEDGGRPFDFIPGQYLTFRFDQLGAKPLVRSYTMSGSPSQLGQIIVTVKKVEGGVVSSWFIDQAKVGEVLRARGPIGKFCYFPETDRPHLFMIGAGSGVTPFLSIGRQYATTLGQEGSPKSMSFLFSFRTQQDIIGQALLEDWEGKSSALECFLTFTKDTSSKNLKACLKGRIHPEMISSLIDKYPLEQTTFMTCGPEPMMDMVRHHLLSIGVPESQIKLESFAS